MEPLAGYSNIIQKVTTSQGEHFVIRSLSEQNDPFKTDEIKIRKIIGRLPLYYEGQIFIYRFINNVPFSCD